MGRPREFSKRVALDAAVIGELHRCPAVGRLEQPQLPGKPDREVRSLAELPGLLGI
jgi:hypothetical protein